MASTAQNLESQVDAIAKSIADASELADGNTLIMGIIGDPITQVETPQAINPIFAEMGANIRCVPIHIGARELEKAWLGLESMRNLIGFGVTLPHKNAALALCDTVDQVATRVGAVNVVRREADGSFRGYQFDGRGFVRGLKTQGYNLSGRNCLLIGAGGAAAGIAYALSESGVKTLRICNRSIEKAEALASKLNDDLGRSFAISSKPIPGSEDIIINATSLGMNESDPLPIDPDLIDATMLVAEVVAKPEITALLQAARDRGAAIHSGMHMVRNQVDLIAQHMVDGLTNQLDI
jgi:shikimate dehydrogenase